MLAILSRIFSFLLGWAALPVWFYAVLRSFFYTASNLAIWVITLFGFRWVLLVGVFFALEWVISDLALNYLANTQSAFDAVNAIPENVLILTGVGAWFFQVTGIQIFINFIPSAITAKLLLRYSTSLLNFGGAGS